ncbi:MAG: tyrosinase family protein [Leptolyngbyaceae cyanobacterium SU_3_3]|nr:tyrosinase family protein [Leptolyngbyaceae cyanobacterium SU_3_3]
MSNGKVIRKNVEGLSEEELGLLRQAYTTLQQFDPRDGLEDRSYQTIAGYHGVPRGYCHRDRELFLPWHRAYVHFLEQYVLDTYPSDLELKPGIPWWDWTSDLAHQPVASGGGIPNRFRAEDNPPNPLAQFFIDRPAFGMQRNTIRTLGVPNELPTTAGVAQLLEITDFLEFSLRLEQTPFHDSIHVWVGGHMGVVDWAAYDPIFFSHHCMVDRIWYLWQLRHGAETVPSRLLNRQLLGFDMAVADVLEIGDLGYEYAVNQMVVRNES